MNKEKALERLSRLRIELAEMESFKGKAQLEKKIGKDIDWIVLHKCTDNLPELLLKERMKDLEKVKPAP